MITDDFHNITISNKYHQLREITQPLFIYQKQIGVIISRSV